MDFAISQYNTERQARVERKEPKEKLAGDTVTLNVTSESLRVEETMSTEVVLVVFIRDIIYTSVGLTAKKKELFCFVSNDDRLGRWTCHIFDMPSGSPTACCEVRRQDQAVLPVTDMRDR